MIQKTLLLVIMTAFATVASAQSFPLWERVLNHYSGTTDETPVPSMKMGHMQMSLTGDAKPGDEARATEILSSAAAALSRYSDVK